jgi:hypothetical protein
MRATGRLRPQRASGQRATASKHLAARLFSARPVSHTHTYAHVHKSLVPGWVSWDGVGACLHFSGWHHHTLSVASLISRLTLSVLGFLAAVSVTTYGRSNFALSYRALSYHPRFLVVAFHFDLSRIPWGRMLLSPTPLKVRILIILSSISCLVSICSVVANTTIPPYI